MLINDANAKFEVKLFMFLERNFKATPRAFLVCSYTQKLQL